MERLIFALYLSGGAILLFIFVSILARVFGRIAIKEFKEQLKKGVFKNDDK